MPRTVINKNIPVATGLVPHAIPRMKDTFRKTEFFCLWPCHELWMSGETFHQPQFFYTLRGHSMGHTSFAMLPNISDVGFLTFISKCRGISQYSASHIGQCRLLGKIILKSLINSETYGRIILACGRVPIDHAPSATGISIGTVIIML